MKTSGQPTEVLLAIVILNWNGWRDTIDCLESIFSTDIENYLVIVVDNASTDNSVERIREYCNGNVLPNQRECRQSPKPIFVLESAPSEISRRILSLMLLQFQSNSRLLLIRNPENLGYAGGNNIGIQCALETVNPRFVLVLNNDVTVTPTAIPSLLKLASSRTTAGAVAPLICPVLPAGDSNLDEDYGVTRFWSSILLEKRYKSRNLAPPSGAIYPSETLQGSCILFRSEALRKVGLFDSSFFLYWEDTDICLRLRDAGYLLLVSTDARVWHKIARSMARTGGVSYYYFVRNRFLLVAKHKTLFRYILYTVYFIVFATWKDQVGWILRRQRFGIIGYYRAVVDGLRAGILRYTEHVQLRSAKQANLGGCEQKQ